MTSGALTARFQYDASGRRVAKTIGGATTNFLYDGVNPVQEQKGGVMNANILTGLGVDEYFTRTVLGNGIPEVGGGMAPLTTSSRSSPLATGIRAAHARQTCLQAISSFQVCRRTMIAGTLK